MKQTKDYSNYRFVRLLMVIGFLMVSLPSLQASGIRINEATKQKWYSGISYRNGILYNIGLTIFPSKHPIILDTLWLEGNCRSLASYNYKGRTKSDTLSVYISDGLNYDGKIQVDASWCKDPGKKGVIIGYHQNNIRYLLDITPYLKELMSVAYP